MKVMNEVKKDVTKTKDNPTENECLVKMQNFIEKINRDIPTGDNTPAKHTFTTAPIEVSKKGSFFTAVGGKAIVGSGG